MKASGRILFTLLVWELSWKKSIDNPLSWQIQVEKRSSTAVVDRMPARRCGSHF